MILALYEGYRNHYDVFLPLLERYGLIGWFFVITGGYEGGRGHNAGGYSGKLLTNHHRPLDFALNYPFAKQNFPRLAI